MFDLPMLDNQENHFEEKRKLLSDLCRLRGGTCEIRETHMSWLFLGAERVYKLKKPVCYPFLDFSSLELRRHFCMEELRLNRRLAAGSYLSVLPISRTAIGDLCIGEGRETIDWIVEMRRLSDRDMLDRRMRAVAIEHTEVEALARLLSRFYASLAPEPVVATDHITYLFEQLDIDAEVLCRPEFDLAILLSPILVKMREELTKCSGELCQRIALGWFREGHGDLRPEHVWLGQPLQIIDCLEFNRMMRIVDPYAEIVQLGMECDIVGYSWIGGVLCATLAGELGGKPTERLMHFYRTSKTLRRARLCMAHLLERIPRDSAKWRPLALKYINLVDRSLSYSRQR